MPVLLRPPGAPRVARDSSSLGEAREPAHARLGQLQHVQSGHRCPTAHLHDLHAADGGVAEDGMMEPDDAVGHGEHRVAVRLLLEVLADEKRRGLRARERQRETLNEALEPQIALFARVLRDSDDGAKGVHDDGPGIGGVHLAENALEYLVQAAVDHLAEVDEADGVAHLRRGRRTRQLAAGTGAS